MYISEEELSKQLARKRAISNQRAIDIKDRIEAVYNYFIAFFKQRIW